MISTLHHSHNAWRFAHLHRQSRSAPSTIFFVGGQWCWLRVWKLSIVSAWLSCDSHSRVWWEILVQSWVDHTGDLFKFKLCIFRSTKATTNIKQIHAETNFCSQVKYTAGIWHCLHKGIRSIPPLHTWKLTPMTSIFSYFAHFRRRLLVLSVAPDLTPSRQTALESSVTIHKNNFVLQCALTTFINSFHCQKSSSGIHYWQHTWFETLVYKDVHRQSSLEAL